MKRSRVRMVFTSIDSVQLPRRFTVILTTVRHEGSTRGGVSGERRVNAQWCPQTAGAEYRGRSGIARDSPRCSGSRTTGWASR